MWDWDELERKVDRWNESRKDKPSPRDYFYFVLGLIPLLILLAFFIIIILLIWFG